MVAAEAAAAAEKLEKESRRCGAFCASGPGTAPPPGPLVAEPAGQAQPAPTEPAPAANT